jgi:hypothetical protein
LSEKRGLILERSIEKQELLSILEDCDPAWLARALFLRQQSDPILEKLCELKAAIEKGKRGDVEALSQGLETALDLPGSRRQSFLSDDYDLILIHSTDDLASLRDLPSYEEHVRPLLERFVIRAASASTEFEEGFSWWSALEHLCDRLNLPVPDSP